jgi:hypothetical protein
MGQGEQQIAREGDDDEEKNGIHRRPVSCEGLWTRILGRPGVKALFEPAGVGVKSS